MIQIRLIVESDFDAMLAKILIERAFEHRSLEVLTEAPGGKIRAVRRLNAQITALPANAAPTIALVDADASSVAEARHEIEASSHLLRNSANREAVVARIFFAVPEIEAWLFADTDNAKRFARRRLAALDRIKVPDDMPLSKPLAEAVFRYGPGTGWAKDIVEAMDLNVAVAHSPSLRDFLRGVGKLIGDDQFEGISEAYNILGARLLGSLIAETNPKDAIMFRTLGGETFTAERLEREIAVGGEIAREYAETLLRIARDQLARQARRKKA